MAVLALNFQDYVPVTHRNHPRSRARDTVVVLRLVQVHVPVTHWTHPRSRARDTAVVSGLVPPDMPGSA